MSCPRLANERGGNVSARSEGEEARRDGGKDQPQLQPQSRPQSEPQQPRPGQPRCDFGETCICRQPASEHPGHEWILSFAGYYKFGCQRVRAGTRDPEGFGMHTFTQHEAYGAVEVLQNLLLDFEEARRVRNWREQWAVVEAVAMFLLSDWGACAAVVDDGEVLKASAAMVARMALAMLAALDRRHLLSKDSEVKNLGLVMALYLKLAFLLRQHSAFDPAWWLQAQNTSLHGRKGKDFDFNPAKFASYLLTYATKYAIPLYGVQALDRYTSALDAYINMPRETSNTDPWGWSDAFSEYLRLGILPVCAIKTRPRSTIGGDVLDITTWTPEERKMYSARGKDPLGEEELRSIREEASA